MKLHPEGRACPGSQDASAADASLAWLSPVSGAEGRALEEWCRTVGPVIIDSVPAGYFGALQPGDSLAVVTWNVETGSGDILTFIEQELGLDCAASPRPAVAQGFAPFVILAQEAYRRSASVPRVASQAAIPPRIPEKERPGPRLHIDEIARQCGLSIVYVPSRRNGPEEYDGEGEDWGNAILSTLPLSDFIAIELPLGASRRVAVGATVHNARRDSLRVVSIHLSTFPAFWRILRTGNSTRTRHWLAFAEALRTVELIRADSEDESVVVECYPRCGADGSLRHFIPTVVGGDFNTWSPRETALRHARDHFPHSPAWDGKPTRGAFPTDHLLFREGQRPAAAHVVEGSYRRIEDKYHSDHNARIVWLRIG